MECPPHELISPSDQPSDLRPSNVETIATPNGYYEYRADVAQVAFATIPRSHLTRNHSTNDITKDITENPFRPFDSYADYELLTFMHNLNLPEREMDTFLKLRHVSILLI